jgi:hypothetical protein
MYLAGRWCILMGMHMAGERQRLDSRFLMLMSCVAGTVASATLSLTLYDRAGSDWDTLAPAGRLMLGGDLAVYTDAPKAQVGPLALLAAGAVPFPIYAAALFCLFPLFVVQVYRASGATPAVWHLPVFAALGMVWHRWVMMGHLDDLLVILAGLSIVIAGQRGRSRGAAVWFAVALAAKPTAIMLLPLVALQSPMVATLGLAAGGAVYLPFVATDLHGFISAGRGVIFVWPHSVLSFLGVPAWGAVPAWVRPTQLVGVLLIGWLVGRRSLLAGLAAVLAFRPLLEPGGVPSYVAAAMLVVFCLELREHRRPALTGLLAVAWLASFGQLYLVAALMRHGLLVAVLLLIVFRAFPRRQESGWIAEPSHQPLAA